MIYISIEWIVLIACGSFLLGFFILLPFVYHKPMKTSEINPIEPSHTEIISRLYTFRMNDYYNYFYVLDMITPETTKVMNRLVAELTHGMRSEFNENFTSETCRKLGKMLRELDALIICEKPYEEQYKALQAELEKCLDIEEA